MKKNSLIAEFKDFITKGNIIDLAVGIIIGTAFIAIVNSFVGDILMPFIGFILKGENLSAQYIRLSGNSIFGSGYVYIYYGRFLQQIANFFIIAIVVFFLIKLIMPFRKTKEKPVSESELTLLKEIRDLLKNKDINKKEKLGD